MALVRWWPFNGDANDYTATGQHLINTSSGVTIDNNGKIGKCAYYNGGQGYTPNPLLGRNIFSICFWAKPNGAAAWSDIFTVETSRFRLEKGETDKYNFYLDSGQTGPVATGVTAISSLPDAVWTHVAIVFDGSKYTTYKNGIVDTTGTLNGNLVTGANFYVGGRISSSYWKGYLNDFRIYDHALSVKEVKEIAKAKMIHYTCNPSERAGIYRDSSGYRNHASATNHPTLSKEDSALGTTSYLFENGSKQSNGHYQHFKSTSAIRIPESGTMSYYLKHAGTQNAENKYAVGFHHFSSVNGLDAGTGVNNTIGLIYYPNEVNYATLRATGPIRDGQWHMYTLSWTVNGTLKIYIDGELVATHTLGAMIHAGTFKDFIVGSAWETTYGGWSGYIDDVRLYATQLSDADVLELYKTRASVSKNGKMFANEICETNFVTKEAYSAKWARIFYHNNKSGTVLFGSDKNEFLSCHTTDKISDLWALERFRDKDEKFELLLEYEDETGYNRWKQTSDFTKTTAITGYEAIACSWTDHFWEGLALSKDSNLTWVDGSPNSGTDNWWYAIGCKSAYQGGIPSGTKAVTGAVSLWVRTDNVSSVKITKKGIVFADEINEVDNTSMKTKTELNANWVRLFYHNIKSGTVLFSTDKKEFLKCNTGDKISDLWALEQFRGKDGKFELLLQYQSGGTEYNRWKQSSNFTKEKIAGYENVACSWTSNYWGGLEPDTSGNAWVDGSVNHGNWYYAIGSYKNYSSGGMPSWNGLETGWVELWVRCDDINLFRMIKGGKCKATEFIEN